MIQINEIIIFPDTWEEYEKSYGFTDNKEIYTNGARLIPSFRVKQWLDHLSSAQPERKKGKWIYTGIRGRFPTCSCSVCGAKENADWAIMQGANFCPSCGADMRSEQNG